MSRPIATSLSPNTEGDDIALAWHVLTHPSHWRHEPALAKTALMLGRHVDSQFITLTSSGRSALYGLLKAFGITKGDEVILQAFTCLAVPEPILWVGATPVYVDMVPRQYTIDINEIKKKITPHTKAIIVQHTFGIPADIVALQEIAKQRNILLIEDCAHALGASQDGKSLGSFGDAAILSFARDKTISSVYGGAIITKNQALTMKLQAWQKKLDAPPAVWVIQQLLHPIVFYFALRSYFSMSIGKRLIQLCQAAGLISMAVTKSERRGKRPPHINWRYAPALAFLLQNQIAKLEEFTARRQAIAERYFVALSEFDFNLPRVPNGAKPAWLRFPLLVKNPREVLEKAKEEHMLLGDWYDAALVPKDFDNTAFKYTAGSCPIAEDAATHVINLPTYPLLTDEQVDHIIEFTKRHAKPYYETL